MKDWCIKYDQIFYSETVKNFSKRVYDQTTCQFGLRCCHVTDIFLSVLTPIYPSLPPVNIRKP